MILADTSVWIDHFRIGNRRLEILLEEDFILCHPFVIGELACGNLKARDHILNLLKSLPESLMAEHGEVMHFVRSHRLHGLGLGWIDMHLLTSAFLSECGLWTLDKPLRRTAEVLGIFA